MSGQQVAKSRLVSEWKFKPIADIANSVVSPRWKLAYLIKAGWAG